MEPERAVRAVAANALDLFINHSLWSRKDGRIFFFARAEFDRRARLDVLLTMKADGTDLRLLGKHIGGHPEWESDTRMIGLAEGRQVLFDVNRREVTGTLGTPEIFPQPGGDVALSPDGKWFVNGHGEKGKNFYTFLRRSDGAWVRSEGIDQSGYTGGNLRIDPSPCWNRDGTQILFAGIAPDAQKTRQLFVMTVRRKTL